MEGPHCPAGQALTTMLAAMTSGSTQMDSTKKVCTRTQAEGQEGGTRVIRAQAAPQSTLPTQGPQAAEAQALLGLTGLEAGPPTQGFPTRTRPGRQPRAPRAPRPPSDATRSHLVAVLLPEIRDGRPPLSGGVCGIENLGPNWVTRLRPPRRWRLLLPDQSPRTCTRELPQGRAANPPAHSSAQLPSDPQGAP